MPRIQRGRPKTSRTSKNVSNENKHSTDVPYGSGSHSHSLATPPAAGEPHHVEVWDPDNAHMATWEINDDWNNPQGDNTWEWEAAGDGSIASDDPFRDKKLAWRKEHDHVYTYEHRVRRWREKLPVKRLLLSRTEEIERCVEPPPEEELWDGASGCKLEDRERSQSRGPNGRKKRAAKIEEWKQTVEMMIAERGLAVQDEDSLNGTFSQEMERWFDELVKEPKWTHLKKAKAKAFFEMPMTEKISQVERLIRQIDEAPSWDI